MKVLKKPRLTATMIRKAVRGDEDAISDVIQHYKPYLRVLATRIEEDQYGNPCVVLDHDKYTHLQLTLALRIPIFANRIA